MSSRILVIQTAFVGDLLLTIPLIKRLKVTFSAEVDLVCRKGLGSLMRDLDLVGECFELDKKTKSLSSNSVFETQYSHVFCPHMSLTSANLARKVQAKEKVSYRQWWNGVVFNHRVGRPMNYPEALRELALLTEFDGEVAAFFSKNEKDFRFMGTSDWPEWASMALCDPTGRRHGHVLIAPGSVWSTKRWTESGFARVAEYFLAKSMKVSLIGAPDEEEVCRRVEELSPGVLNLCGKTSLSESYRLFQEADLIVGNDSGAIHLAAVAGLPSVSVFGPTTLDLGYRPWQKQAVVEQVELSCRPCGLHGAQKCPIGTHECMTKVSAEQVIHSAEKLIESL